MVRLQLPQIHAPKSSYLIQFEKELEELNCFYWVYRSAVALMMGKSKEFLRTTDFLPQPEASRLDIACSDLDAASEKADRIARYGMLVQAITYHEVYLERIVSQIIEKRWPGDRQVTIKIKPSDLPNGDIHQYIKSSIISSEVKSIIDESYAKRSSRITNLLKNCGFHEPDHNNERKELIIIACEIRNCIVHSGGRIDERAKISLSSKFPTTSIGDQLELAEGTLWELLGAILDDARAIDSSIRKKQSDKNIVRKDKMKAHYNQRKGVSIFKMRRQGK